MASLDTRGRKAKRQKDSQTCRRPDAQADSLARRRVLSRMNSVGDSARAEETLDENDLDAMHQFCESLAQEAGALILAAFRKSDATYEQKSRTDPVTETDLLVERVIKARIHDAYPSHVFIGEESVSESGEVPPLTLAPTWILDPIDGTCNFVHRIPMCCCSIALAIGGELVVGAVCNPVSGELFSARRGCGAFLNKQRIAVSSGVRALDQAAVATEFGSSRDAAKVDLMLHNARRVLVEHAQALRSTGSAALNLCYVACGRFDAYYEWGPYIWDVAAGALLVTEAGGVLADPERHTEPFDMTSRRIVAAASPQLLSALLPTLGTREPATPSSSC
ncbi:Inositol monophosphatase [Porphyridium purpureum]|uniref:Inositol-1-monophosphatase n=1 Tax=Porphyridium purpureum TaxID=35688 RepID=A0A5J4YQT2_PORPP|nr:Inositol monophosphatase [Porphyridium purpureum]|eukprot:POR7285..scf222_8